MILNSSIGCQETHCLTNNLWYWVVYYIVQLSTISFYWVLFFIFTVLDKASLRLVQCINREPKNNFINTSNSLESRPTSKMTSPCLWSGISCFGLKLFLSCCFHRERLFVICVWFFFSFFRTFLFIRTFIAI